MKVLKTKSHCNLSAAIFLLSILATTAFAQSSGGPFQVTSSVVGGGGGSSSGGSLTLDGTVNEPSASNTLSGNMFTLDGGFWNIFDAPPGPTPTPSPISGAGSTLVDESCPPGNGAIDPGERVTVMLMLVNNGPAATTNLVATVQSNANVLSPSGPQSYGAIALGQIVGRDFAFTADGNPGDMITVTLLLQDGMNNLGWVNYTFTLGSNTACQGAPRISTSTALTCSGSNKVANIRISNSGTATAFNVMLTVANLGGVSGTPLPQSAGNLTPGQSATLIVTFVGAPTGLTNLQVGGTYIGGTFNSNRRVTVPACP